MIWLPSRLSSCLPVSLTRAREGHPRVALHVLCPAGVGHLRVAREVRHWRSPTWAGCTPVMLICLGSPGPLRGCTRSWPGRRGVQDALHGNLFTSPTHTLPGGSIAPAWPPTLGQELLPLLMDASARLLVLTSFDIRRRRRRGWSGDGTDGPFATSPVAVCRRYRRSADTPHVPFSTQEGG